MKIKCQREPLQAAFQTAAGVVPARSPKPILQNVKLEVSDGRATLLATDLEISVRTDVPGVEVEVPGAAILAVGRFGSILKESSDETLRIEADGQGTIVQGERSEFKFAAENPEEFPQVKQFEGDKFHEVPARLLREIIRRTAFATDNESSRYALGGVLFEFEEQKITGVGTDGRRLAKMEGAAASFGGHVSGDATVIVPTRATQLIERAFTDADAELKVAARENEILVGSERTTVTSRLLEGRFPRWREVFPDRTGAVKIELCAGPFHSAVRQAAIVTSEESRGVDFAFGGGNVVLSGRAAELGQSRVELPIGYDGDELAITLDPRFVNDFLRTLEPSSTLTLELQDAGSAAVASTDDGYSYVIMPLARDR